MKLIKKAAVAATAAAVALSLLASGAIAAASESEHKIYIDSEKASVGDTTKVMVKIDTLKGLSSVDFALKYDTESLELVQDSAITKKPLESWIVLLSQTDGKITYGGYILDGEGFSSDNTEMLEVEFKVLKPNAKLTLDEIMICQDDIGASDITDEFAVVNGTIECSHKNAETKTTPSTCKDKGKEETVCKDCGETVSVKELPLAEHTWDKGTVTKPASCTEKGETTYKCTVCGETKTEEIPASGHDYVEVKEESKEPTCTESGKRVSKCFHCGNIIEEEIPAAGHSWGEWKTVNEPTKESEGLEERECAKCGAKESRAIDKLAPDDGTTASSYTESPIDTTAASDTESPAESTTASAAENPMDTTTAADSEGPAQTTAAGGTQGDGNNNNYPTGIVIAVLPLLAAGTAVIAFSRKRR